MIVALVRFPLDPPLSLDEGAKAFEQSAPSYQGLPGLLRKHYLLAPDGSVGGGVYLWASRADAERFYDEAWRERLTKRYGSPPSLEYFESPVTVEPDAITTT